MHFVSNLQLRKLYILLVTFIVTLIRAMVRIRCLQFLGRLHVDLPYDAFNSASFHFTCTQ